MKTPIFRKYYFSILAVISFGIQGVMFVSCEGPKDFCITVIDEETKLPVDSVLVEVQVKRGNKEVQMYKLTGFTDAKGQFKASEMIGTGLSLKKFDYYLSYKKVGYHEKSEKNHTIGTIELEKNR